LVVPLVCNTRCEIILLLLELSSSFFLQEINHKRKKQQKYLANCCFHFILPLNVHKYSAAIFLGMTANVGRFLSVPFYALGDSFITRESDKKYSHTKKSN